MSLLPVDVRKLHWTRSLAQMCSLLEHHQAELVSHTARTLPYSMKGATSLDMKAVSQLVQRAYCSLPSCHKNDHELVKKFQMCTGCEVAKYCSREHQKKHWKKHKPECKVKLKKVT